VDSYQDKRLCSDRLDMILRAFDMRGMSVLDIGCAEGFFCRGVIAAGARQVVGVCTELIDNGFVFQDVEEQEIAGIDARPTAGATWAKIPNLQGRQVIAQYIEEKPWPFANDYWDNVVMGEVLEHVAEQHWPFVLQEAWRVCRTQVLASLPVWNDLHKDIRSDRVGVDEHKYRPSFEALPGVVRAALGDIPWDSYQHIEHQDRDPDGDVPAYVGDKIGFIYMRLVKRPWWSRV